ncbi:hypothetical protein D8674_008572 [Pyrus ussuriensis x Pyrus communis]|uniref:DUF4283 domain-containing protein n=1 Tax=Pyrus ussuriensis x Pyrus communis TaxID=2448454 RepID=A0A5N5HW65_9ROSA|nr:hypothetical protein D8674_008572 [Pyrus ussuriensis x Pyrus communis]
MLSRVLMGKMFGQLFDACLIKWNTFYLDHFGRKWFALEFTDEDDLKYVLNNRPYGGLGDSVQYKEKQIIRDITQPIGKVDLRFPLKRVLIINHNDDSPILISYEKLFEVCCYCGRMCLEGHSCAEFETDDGCFMIDKAFEDEPTVYPEDVVVDEDIKACLQDDVMLCFPKAANVEDYMECEESGQ